MAGAVVGVEVVLVTAVTAVTVVNVETVTTVVVVVVVAVVVVVVVVKDLMCVGGSNSVLEAGMLTGYEVVQVHRPRCLQRTSMVNFWIWNCWKGWAAGDVRERRSRCAWRSHRHHR